MLKRIFFYFSIFILTSGNLFAQHQKDAAMWLSVNIEKKINKRFSVNFIHQTSLNQNLNEVGYLYYDLGLSYKLNKYFTIACNYRLSELRNLENFYSETQRFYSDLTFSKGFGKFYLQIRTRFQTQVYGLNYQDFYKPNRDFSRNKISLRYNINRIYSTFISAEQFYRFNKINNTQAYRFAAGLTYKFNLKHRIDVYYMNQFQLNTKRTRTDYITGLTYSYKF